MRYLSWRIIFVKYFCKAQANYGVDFVVETMLTLRTALFAKQKSTVDLRDKHRKPGAIVETPDDRRARIYKRIDIELDMVGIRARLKGRVYLREAIFYKIQDENLPSAL